MTQHAYMFVYVVKAVFERLHRLVRIHEKNSQKGRESRVELGTDETPVNLTQDLFTLKFSKTKEKLSKPLQNNTQTAIQVHNLVEL